MKKIILLLMAFVCVSSVIALPKKDKKNAVISENQNATVIPEATFANGKLDSIAYAFGMIYGSQFSNFADSGAVTGPAAPEVVMNLNNFLAAFVPAMRKDTSKAVFPVEKAQALVQSFQMEMRQKMEEMAEAKIKENKEKGEAYMATNAQKPNIKTTESGVQVEIISEGTGAQPKDGDNVTVNYKGMLVDGTVFDANDNVDFNIEGVVPGFKDGIKEMKEGGKYIITIPSDLGYGDRGAGENIPGGSVIIFEVDLIKVNSPFSE